MMVADGVGRRREGKQVVDRGRHLERPLVAVAHAAGDPFRIDDAGAHDARHLLVERADPGRFGPRVVIVIDRRRRPGQVLDRRGEAAFELIVVAAVEQVMLAVVLVLDDRVDLAQPRLEQVVRRRAFAARRIDVAAPFEIGAREVAGIFPALLVDQRLQPGAIGARLGAEHAACRAAGGFGGRRSVLDQVCGLRAHARGERVHRPPARPAPRHRAPPSRTGR